MKHLIFHLDESSDDEEYQLSDQIENDSEDENENENVNVNVNVDENENKDDGNEDDEMGVMANNMSWRDNLAQKARAAYLDRQSNTQNLMKIVYGAIRAVCFQINFDSFYKHIIREK